MRNHNGKRAAILGLASAAWIGVLFFFSGQSGDESGSLSMGLVELLFGGLIERGADPLALEHLLRKLAHLGIFAVAGFLLALTGACLLPRRRAMLCAVGCSAVLAVTNELHELLSPERTCSPADMLIDFAGALLGILAAAAVLHAFSSARHRKNQEYDTTGD